MEKRETGVWTLVVLRGQEISPVVNLFETHARQLECKISIIHVRANSLFVIITLCMSFALISAWRADNPVQNYELLKS